MLEWINNLFEHEVEETKSLLDPGLRRVLVELLRDCESLYRSAALRCIRECPERIDGDVDKYGELLRDLHRGALIKTLIEIASCDSRWSGAERHVAMIVLQHAWGVQVSDSALANTLQNVADHATTLKWDELVKPFVEIPQLADERSTLRTTLLRLANLIAKADGSVLPDELIQIDRMGRELDSALKREKSTNNQRNSTNSIQIDRNVAALVHPKHAVEPSNAPNASTTRDQALANTLALNPADREKMFKEAMAELDAMIGLDQIKADIRRFVDFLKIQAVRLDHKLPKTKISLHAIFEGNPGTGKTSVARILGRLLSGLGLLDKGQTIETDRSGLVAQYAGQTGPRTNSRVDEALGGVLFVDEAYSIVAENGEDPFGNEALQTLLKRMEDDRDRFIVVLAGYPEPMLRMLQSNPGVLSRFQHTYRFPDYTPQELLKIFYTLSKQHHYRLPKETQKKLLAGFQRLVDVKDEHFGNGRLARNLFEQSIRHMASRIVSITPLTRDLLITLEPEDIVMHTADVPNSAS